MDPVLFKVVQVTRESGIKWGVKNDADMALLEAEKVEFMVMHEGLPFKEAVKERDAQMETWADGKAEETTEEKEEGST